MPAATHGTVSHRGRGWPGRQERAVLLMRFPRVTQTGVPGSWLWVGKGCPAVPAWPGCERRPCPPLQPHLSTFPVWCIHTPSAPATRSCSELQTYPAGAHLQACVQAVLSAPKAFLPLLCLSSSHSLMKIKAGITSSREPSLMSLCPKLG